MNELRDSEWKISLVTSSCSVKNGLVPLPDFGGRPQGLSPEVSWPHDQKIPASMISLLVPSPRSFGLQQAIIVSFSWFGSSRSYQEWWQDSVVDRPCFWTRSQPVVPRHTLSYGRGSLKPIDCVLLLAPSAEIAPATSNYIICR